MACVEGLTGLLDALETSFPRTQVQLCIGLKVRQSLRSGVWRERRAVARNLRTIDGAPTVTEAEAAVERFALTWDAHDPTIAPASFLATT